ncbi:MAG: prolipoprotein diacylglyceryl transferase [bacterium]|nr:prolipoprotein diacylglyceryl transferase [bacterium]
MNIYFYGVILALAIVAGTLFSEHIATKYFELKKETIIDLAPYLIIFGILGARLYYCCLNYDFYLRFPTEILAIRHGGISIHGAILGGIVGLWIFSVKRKLNMIKLADVTVVGLALAQSIGRWGNFFNSEAFGRPTELAWKLYIAPQYRPVPYENYEYFHPTFLYESILDFILFIILYKIVQSKKNGNDGNLALIYLILYSIIRIFVEYYRIDSVVYIYGIPVAIIVSILLVVIASTLLICKNIGMRENE